MTCLCRIRHWLLLYWPRLFTTLAKS